MLNLVVHTVTTAFSPFNGSLDAPYGPLVLHMLSVLVHCTVMNALKETIDLKPLRPLRWL
jgi:hypothetical protein